MSDAVQSYSEDYSTCRQYCTTWCNGYPCTKSPVRVTGLPTNPNYQLGGGGYGVFTFVAVLSDGSAVGSGKNDHGQLATGDTANVLTAGPLPGLGAGVVATARGYGFMLLLKRP